MATECSIGCPELVDTACAHPSHTPTGESILVTIRMMLIMTDHGSPDSQDTYILVTTRLLHMQSFEEAAIFILMDAVCKSARRQLSSRAVNGKDAQLAGCGDGPFVPAIIPAVQRMVLSHICSLHRAW